MNDDVIRVEWFDGGFAEVSRQPYQWIVDNVAQAQTPMQRAVLYQIGAKLRALLQIDYPLENEQMRVARRNDAGTTVVAAWDAFIKAISDHPTFRSDFAAAAHRREMDDHAAGAYAATLREVIDGYRTPEALPKGGRPTTFRQQLLIDATNQVKDALAIPEASAVKIVASMATMIGVDADAECLRQATRNHRVKK